MALECLAHYAGGDAIWRTWESQLRIDALSSIIEGGVVERAARRIIDLCRQRADRDNYYVVKLEPVRAVIAVENNPKTLSMKLCGDGQVRLSNGEAATATASTASRPAGRILK